ncbi:MAG: DNA/RNA non-specific endonuclease [Eubacteriales bacterium]
MGEISQNPEKEKEKEQPEKENFDDKAKKSFWSNLIQKEIENAINPLARFTKNKENDRKENVPPTKEEMLDKLFRDPIADEVAEKPEKSEKDDLNSRDNNLEKSNVGISNDKTAANSSYKEGDLICKTDDNGKTYQKGKDLLPNETYVLNGYKYKTDKQGRVSSAKGDVTKEKINDDKRKNLPDKMDDIGKGDQRETDQRGHIIGDKLGGDNTLGNLIPQDAKLNNGKYKSMEEKLKKATQDGKDVSVDIKIRYDDKTRRPSEIRVVTTINGEKTSYKFKNEGEK